MLVKEELWMHFSRERARDEQVLPKGPGKVQGRAQTETAPELSGPAETEGGAANERDRPRKTEKPKVTRYG